MEISCGRRSFAVHFEDHFRSGNHLRSGISYGTVYCTLVKFLRRELKRRHWDLFSETEAFHQARHRTSGCCSCQRSPSLTGTGAHYPCSIICVPFLVNGSFSSSNFPDKVKLTRITSVFKKGSRFDKDNYRPISVLSNFSKLFEKVMYCRLCSYLE